MAKSIIGDLRDNFKTAGTLHKLIYVNIGLFLFILIANNIVKLFTGNNFDLVESLATKWLAVPSDPHELILKPWTLITYMFLHFEFFHILFNLLWLYWMGSIFNEFLGSKKLFSTYILGGIAGALLYVISCNVFPLFRSNSINVPMLGASASVMAITVAAATLVPNYSIRLILIGAIPLKYIALFSVLLDLISMGKLDNVAHFAHIGGAIYGFAYIRRLQNGKDIAAWFNRLMDRITLGASRSSNMKVKYRRAVSDEDFVANKKSQQERVDEILDKISKSGYGSLSQEEKDILFKSSKE